MVPAMPFCIRRLLATGLAALAVQTPCAAQGIDAWAELTPPGGVAATAVKGQGKLVTYDAGNQLHVFSSVTRSWLEVAKTAGASLTVFNDCALLVDGSSMVAVSSYYGHPAKLVVSPNATLWNGANAKNDSIMLVRDGQELHAFSAFTGTWSTRAIPATASGSVQRHVAVVQSGTQLIGMSAFDGQWHAIDAPSVTSLNTDGTAGFAIGPNVYAFSAHTRSWSQHPALGNATFARGDDWGLWHDASGGFAYSGLTGSFTAFSLGGAYVAASSDLYALLDDGTSLHAWSAVTADFVPLGPSPSAIDAGLGAALLHDANSVRGYSALRQQVQALPTSGGASAAGASVAHVVDSAGQLFAFSAVTGTWHAAPASTVGRTPLTTTTTVAIDSPNDCFAFAANTGQFVPLGHAVLGLSGNPSSAPLLAHDAASLFAFDSDQARWISTARTGTSPPTFRIWRTTALVMDGDSAHGVGAQAGMWHRFDLGTQSASPFANSEVAYLVGAQRLLACAMLPEIVSLQQFPHFRRVQPRGAEVVFSTTPVRDALVIAGFAPRGTPTTLPGIGELHLDLASAVLVAPDVSGPSGVGRIAWSLPPSPALAGSTMFAQLLMIPTNGTTNGGVPYLGDRATVQLW